MKWSAHENGISLRIKLELLRFRKDLVKKESNLHCIFWLFIAQRDVIYRLWNAFTKESYKNESTKKWNKIFCLTKEC